MPWMSDLSECGAAAGGGSHGTVSKGRFYYGRGARSTPNGQSPTPKVNAPWWLGVGSWELTPLGTMKRRFAMVVDGQRRRLVGDHRLELAPELLWRQVRGLRQRRELVG